MKEKIDKGFCLIYNKLSNRRKLITSVWFLGFLIVYLSYIVLDSPTISFLKGSLLSVSLLCGFFHIILCYRKWKKEPI